jgi:hypothetical protein
MIRARKEIQMLLSVAAFQVLGHVSSQLPHPLQTPTSQRMGHPGLPTLRSPRSYAATSYSSLTTLGGTICECGQKKR